MPRGQYVRKPRKLTPEAIDRIIALVRAGNYIETSAASAGVDRDTLYVRMKKDKDFAERLHKAVAEAEALDVARIAAAAATQWQASAWRLERRHPERWGQRVQLTVKQELANALQRIEAVVDAATYDRILDSLADGGGGALPAPAEAVTAPDGKPE